MSTPSLRSRLLRDSVVALAVLVALEGVVRVGGWADGPDPSIPDNAVVEEGAADRPYLEPAPQPGYLQTSRVEVEAGRMRDLRFTAEPAVGTTRVVLLGGSVAKGVPLDNDPPRTIAGRLEAHLQRAGHTVEVLNLAGASYTTAHVARVARDVVQARPHAIVVYSGGNEYRAFTRRLWEQNQGWRGAVRAGQGIHVVRLLGRLAGVIRGDAPPGQAQDAVHEVIAGQSELVEGVMERLLDDAGPAGLPTWSDNGVPVRRDPAAQAVTAAYREGLEVVAAAAASMDPPPVLLVVKPPGNKFTPPQLSLHTPGLSNAQKAEFHRNFDAGAAAQRRGDCRSAVGLFEAALAIDSLYADAWHQHARCLLEVGDPSGTARRNLDIAVELDFAPDRAGRALYEVVDGLVDRTDARTLDLSADFGPRRDFGRDAFHDHVHLKPSGQDLIGRRVAEALSPLLRPAP